MNLPYQVSKTIQEKSALADTKLNESLDLLQTHTRQILTPP